MHRAIGQEKFGFAGYTRPASSLDEIGALIEWRPVAALVDPLYSANQIDSSSALNIASGGQAGSPL